MYFPGAKLELYTAKPELYAAKPELYATVHLFIFIFIFLKTLFGRGYVQVLFLVNSVSGRISIRMRFRLSH